MEIIIILMFCAIVYLFYDKLRHKKHNQVETKEEKEAR